MLTLYDYLPSQNAYKIRLLLSHLDRAYKTQEVSIFEGHGQKPEYLAVNPTGAVPAIALPDGRLLAESNAILLYLARGSVYLPEDPYEQARITQWLCFEGDYVQAGIATLRHWVLTGKDQQRAPALLESKRQLSLKTMNILERELSGQPFIAGAAYTIADMSLFAYVHLCEDAWLSLTRFEHLRQWINRVQGQVGFLDKMYPYSIDPHSANEL